MNLAFHDIRHSLGRFLLTCLGLSLLLGVVYSMIGIYRGMVDDALTLARAPQADIWVVETGSRGRLPSLHVFQVTLERRSRDCMA